MLPIDGQRVTVYWDGLRLVGEHVVYSTPSAWEPGDSELLFDETGVDEIEDADDLWDYHGDELEAAGFRFDEIAAHARRTNGGLRGELRDWLWQHFKDEMRDYLREEGSVKA